MIKDLLVLFTSGSTGSIVVCISPLTAIMIDQRAKFTLYGLTTEFLGEAQDDQSAIMNVLQGRIQLVFVSPEAIIQNRKYRSMLLTRTYKDKLVALVVDEVHCVMTW